MIGTTRLKAPGACTERERQEFARLVRRGFNGSDDGLEGRIRGAKQLAFCYLGGDTPVGIAGLKAPSERLRESVFEKADASIGPSPYTLELGWVFVEPAHRAGGVATELCRQLLACESTTGIYSTTRTNNTPMIEILLALGFERTGKPYPYRGQEHVVFFRSAPHATGGPP